MFAPQMSHRSFHPLLALLLTAATPALSGGCGDVGSVGGQGGPGGGADAAVPVERVRAGLQLLYLFDEGQGLIAHDSSNVGVPADLILNDEVASTWIVGGGLHLESPTILRSGTAAAKIYNACQSADAISVEAWIEPKSRFQDGPARIVSFSVDALDVNFALSQDATLVDARLRATDTGLDGTPATRTNDASFTAGVQHIVYTRDGVNDLGSVYVDGNLMGTQLVAGSFADWNPAAAFAIGNEQTQDLPWLGDIRLLAVYCKSLTLSEIAQNRTVGY